MNTKYLSQPVFTVLSLSFLLFSFALITSGQGKSDIEVKVQTASDIARGGEAFPYTVTVTNLGPVKANDVVLLTRTSVSFFQLVSGQSIKGSCSKTGDYSEQVLRCTIGNLLPAESVVVEIQAKLDEVGDRNESEEPFGPNGEIYGSTAPPPPPPPPAKKGSLNEPPAIPQVDILLNRSPIVSRTVESHTASEPGTDLASIHAFASNDSEDSTKNRVNLTVTVLPSRNIPPRIQIVSPMFEARIKKSIARTLNVPISIKAFDPDGYLARVHVNDPRKYDEIVGAYPFRQTFEGPDSKYFIGDREFSHKELENFYTELGEKVAVSARRSGKDTFDFLWTDLKYGRNDIHISTTDNGGRIAFITLTVHVISDAEVEFVVPENNQVLTPDKSIRIEVLAKIKANSNTVLKLERSKEGSYPSPFADQPLKEMRRPGSEALYSFDWRQIPEGVYNLSAVLFEKGIETLRVPGPRILVREPQTIKITSLNDSRVFRSDQTIPIAFEALTSKGEPSFDRFELIVDGKYITEISNSFERTYENADSDGPPVQRIVKRNNPYQLRSLDKGTHTIQIIAKEGLWTGSAILAKSDEVIVVVK